MSHLKNLIQFFDNISNIFSSIVVYHDSPTSKMSSKEAFDSMEAGMEMERYERNSA